MASTTKWTRALFLLRVTPVVVATGLRIRRLDRTLGFGDLVTTLRARSENPLPDRLARPELLAESVEKLLRALPPQRYGPCLRRALILLDLWSRCGLDPKLHLGFRPRDPELTGHAWLTAATADGARLAVSGPLDAAVSFEI